MPSEFITRVISVEDQGKVVGMFPVVDVAVAVIRLDRELLAVYNNNWGAFTLPMTKRRTWQDPHIKKGTKGEEKWEDAAIRATVECLGYTITEQPELLLEHAEFLQSQSSGEWKRYRMKTFEVEVEKLDAVRGELIAEWLPPDDFLDVKRRPISPTARHIVAELKLRRKL